jgi:cell division protein FtsZ
VVATGMDGASIAAIEPKLERRPLTAPPLLAPERQGAPVAQPAPQAYARVQPQPAPAPAPAYVEPARAVEPADEEQPDLYAAPVAQAAPAVIQPMTRIVDPAVDDEPLFSEPAYEERRPRGGFLSLFGGRPRYEAQAPQPSPAPRPMTTRGSAQPIEVAAPEPEASTGEDLEIPSFLRRLAN